jgi:hypothetical protein
VFAIDILNTDFFTHCGDPFWGRFTSSRKLSLQVFCSYLHPTESAMGNRSARVQSVLAPSVSAPAAGFRVEQKRVTGHWSPLR